jgi:hypothetical protein
MLGKTLQPDEGLGVNNFKKLLLDPQHTKIGDNKYPISAADKFCSNLLPNNI